MPTNPLSNPVESSIDYGTRGDQRAPASPGIDGSKRSTINNGTNNRPLSRPARDVPPARFNPMSDSDAPSDRLLEGDRVVLVGRLASMSKRDATQLIREHGGTVVDRSSGNATWIVIGEAELPILDLSDAEEWLDAETREAADEGRVRVATETQLWQHLGMVDADHDIHRLYTPAMLADLLNVDIGTIRRWHRRGLIKPAQIVRRLPYFDFQEVATARRLAEMLAAGIRPRRPRTQTRRPRPLPP